MSRGSFVLNEKQQVLIGEYLGLPVWEHGKYRYLEVMLSEGLCITFTWYGEGVISLTGEELASSPEVLQKLLELLEVTYRERKEGDPCPYPGCKGVLLQKDQWGIFRCPQCNHGWECLPVVVEEVKRK